jgi:hypothetical protein
MVPIRGALPYLFLHWRPQLLRNYFIARFLTGWGWLVRPDRTEVARYANSVNLVSLSDMRELFPNCRIEKEKFLWMNKSLIAVRDALKHDRIPNIETTVGAYNDSGETFIHDCFHGKGYGFTDDDIEHALGIANPGTDDGNVGIRSWKFDSATSRGAYRAHSLPCTSLRKQCSDVLSPILQYSSARTRFRETAPGSGCAVAEPFLFCCRVPIRQFNMVLD